jgi:hypothetical protein
MVTSVDERPILLCRVDVPPHLQKELDDWSPEHFDDFGRHPTVQAVSSYKIIRDFDPVSGLPAAFNSTQATRFIPYVCLDIPSMLEWVGSDIVTGGLDEPTLAREGKYPPIAEEPFNGTMLTVHAVRGALGTDHPGRGGIVAERWEVGPDRAAEFDAWLEGHLSRYEALDGWIRLRILHGDRTAEHRFPWNRYLGKGNRMLLAELREGVDPKAFVRAAAYGEMLLDSLRWDAVLPYTTREVGESFILQDVSHISESSRIASAA